MQHTMVGYTATTSVLSLDLALKVCVATSLKTYANDLISRRDSWCED